MIRRVNADGSIDAGGPFTPIIRPRVIDRIAASARLRVCLIVAPAGFGKTTAMQQYLAQVARPIIRFSARSEHATALGFIRGIAEAAAEFAPGLRSSLPSAYEASRQTLEPANELARWIATHLAQFSGLVAIDDLHLCTPDPEVRALISALVTETHDNVRWLFVSRAWSGLPVASWLAYGLCDIAIDERDLAFSSYEAREFAKSTRLSVRDEEVLKLVELTEGWPTALSFALRNSTRSHDLRHVRASTRDLLFAFLAEQEYESLTEPERELLEFSSVVGAIDVKVLEVAGFFSAREVLETLRQSVAFIAPGEHEAHFLLHDLIREFFLHRAMLRGVEHNRIVHIRVASALEQTGKIAGAVEVLAGAGESKAVLRLLYEHGITLVERGSSDIVMRAIASLDNGVRASDSMVLYLRGLLDGVAGDGMSAERLLRLAYEHMTDPVMRRELLLRRAILAGNSGGDAKPLLARLIEDPQCEIGLRIEALAVQAIVFARAGEHEEATTRLLHIESGLDVLLDDDVRARILQRTGLACLDLGRIDQAHRMLEESARLALERDLVIVASRAHACLAVLFTHGERNLGRQLYHARAAHRFGQRAGSQFDIRTALLHELHVACERAEIANIESFATKLSQIAPSDRQTRLYVTLALAKRAFFMEDFEEAVRLVEPAIHSLTDRTARLDAISFGALSAVQCGQSEKAAEFLTMGRTLLREILSGEWDPAMAPMLALFTLALSGKGQASLALRYVKNVTKVQTVASALARDLCELIIGYRRGEDVWEPRFRGMIDDLRALDFIGFASVISVIYERLHQERSDDSPRLTPSERRVLQLLGEGLSSKQIAREVGRSVFTVQAHIQNIFGKLGVHDRTEAIEHAVRHGLVNIN